MEKEKKTKKEKNNVLKGIIGVCVVVAVIIVVILLCRGESTVTGNYPEDYSSKSLSCNAEGNSYPIFTYDYSYKKTMETKIVFNNSGANTFYLRHTLYYSNQENVVGSEAHNIASLYKSFASDGLEAGALGSNFSKLDGKMQFTLFAPMKDMGQVTYKYFLLDKTAGKMTTLEEYKEAYENQGFRCSVSE